MLLPLLLAALTPAGAAPTPDAASVATVTPEYYEAFVERKLAVLFLEDVDCTPRHWPPPLQDPCVAARPEFERAAAVLREAGFTDSGDPDGPLIMGSVDLGRYPELRMRFASGSGLSFPALRVFHDGLMQPFTDFLPPSTGDPEGDATRYAAPTITRVVGRLASATAVPRLVTDLSGGGKHSAYGAFAEAQDRLSQSGRFAPSTFKSLVSSQGAAGLGMLYCSSERPACHAARLAWEEVATLLETEEASSRASTQPRLSLGWADCARSKVCTADHVAAAAAELNSEQAGVAAPEPVAVVTLVRAGGIHIPYGGPPLLCASSPTPSSTPPTLATPPATHATPAVPSGCGAKAVLAELRRMLGRQAVGVSTVEEVEALRQGGPADSEDDGGDGGDGPRSSSVVVIGFLDAPGETLAAFFPRTSTTVSKHDPEHTHVLPGTRLLSLHNPCGFWHYVILPVCAI
eukprot:COSAG05_NODE_130_length_17165_cov_154.623638_11_plen_460_part_00